MASRSAIPWMLLALLLSASSPTYADNAPRLNVDGIASVMGRKGTLSGDMYKVSFPRSDLIVKVGTVEIKPAFALTSWAAFIKSGDAAVCYGDLVLLEDEINPVITRLEEQGIELSALHNHLLHETPRIMYIHFVGRGDELAMAKGLRDAIALTKTPPISQPSQSEAKPELAAELEKIIGVEGAMGGGVFHINVPRDDIEVMAMGSAIPGSMGMNSPLNFQLDGKNAAINGDFILLPSELNRVIKALRANDIEVVSVHNHMLDEEPRLIFMHFWATGDAIKLATGLRFALDQMAAAKH